MGTSSIDQLMQTADSLSEGEMLELARRLVERARAVKAPAVDVNALAGTLSLDEDPMAVQERMRREWE